MHADDPVGSHGRRDPEPESERLDRNLAELLGELRVALPGVQVLFAFLLVAPFNQRFEQLSAAQERVYLLALCFAGLATAFLMAPTAHHRFTFRLQDKPALVRSANHFAVIGITCMAIAMTMAIWLVTGFIFSSATAGACTGGLAIAFLALWYAYPLYRRQTRLRVIRKGADRVRK